MIKSDLKRNHIHMTPGVYLFKQKSGVILYIGKAKNIKKRLQQYFSKNSLRKQEMVNKAHHIETIETNTEEEALLLETNLILEHKPLYNNLIKGDTAYVYIKIPNEPYPRILLSRYRKNDGAIYIGPKVRKKQLKQSLQIMRTILKYRSCSRSIFKKGRVCSDYFFGLCEGRCVYPKRSGGKHEDINKKTGFTPIYTREKANQRYHNIIQTIKKFFQGDTRSIEILIQQDINDAVKKQNFERAAKLRDVYHSLVHITNTQHINLLNKKDGIFVYFSLGKSAILWSILKLHQGRVVDVIVGESDTDKITQQKVIEREYSIKFQNILEKENIYIIYKFTPKKVSKKEIKQLENQSINAINSFLQSAKRKHISHHNNLLDNIQKRYDLPFFPYTIECIDISHFSGERTTAGISCAQGGIINTSKYRRYKVMTTDTGDDYLALEEVITKRFTKKHQPRPDVFILDGGKGQLQIIKKLTQKNPRLWESIKKKTYFISLGKGNARAKHGRGVNKGIKEYIYSYTTTGDITRVGLKYDLTDRLFIQLRDEAHRFANAYRKKCMKLSYNL